MKIIKMLQHETFAKEIKMIENDRDTAKSDRAEAVKGLLSRTNKLHRLDPFLDEHGIMQVGGRLTRSSLYRTVSNTLLSSRKRVI